MSALAASKTNAIDLVTEADQESEQAVIRTLSGAFPDHAILADVREKLERWRQDYKQVQPHSALADRSPEEFVRARQEPSAASVRTAWPANQVPAKPWQCSDAADPKLLQLFVPPSADVKGASKATHGHGRTGKAEISTVGRHTSAGPVTCTIFLLFDRFIGGRHVFAHPAPNHDSHEGEIDLHRLWCNA